MGKRKLNDCLLMSDEDNTYVFDAERQILTLKDLLSPAYSGDVSQERRVKITTERLRKAIRKITYILFEVTEKCNFKCFYCGQGENYNQSQYRPLNRNMDMSWDTAKTVLDYYLSIWNENLPNTCPVYICFYGGEPLLNFNLVKKIVEYIEEKKPKNLDIVYNITSNGYLLLKHISYLVTYNFQLEISLDGYEYANFYRKDKSGAETFSIVASNLDFIKTTYPSYFEHSITFQAVVNDRSNLLEIYDFFYERYRKKPKLMEISRANMSISNNIDTCYVDLDEAIKNAIIQNPEACNFYDLSGQHDKEYIEFIISTLTRNHYNHYNEFIYRTRSSLNRIKSSTCVPFDYKLDITTDGYLFPCERTEYQYPLGRVANGDLIVDFDKLAEDYTRIFNHYENLCATCIHEYSCKYCLYCEKDFYKSDSTCSRYQKIDIQNVIKMIDFLKKNPKVLKKIISNGNK